MTDLLAEPANESVVDTNKRRVLFVTKSFPPVRHSGTIRVEAFCRNLPRFGVEPIVLTCADAATRESGRQDCYLDINDTDSVSVMRMPWYTSESSNVLFKKVQARVPLARSLASRIQLTQMAARIQPAIKEMIQKRAVNAVVATVPPGDAAVLGSSLAKYFHLPFIIDLRDPWSYWPMPLYNHYLDFLYERYVESRILRQAAFVVVTTHASKELLVSKLGVPPLHIHVISNGYNEDDFANANTSYREDRDRFVITYTGSINDPRHISLRQRIARRLGFNFDPLHTNYDARSAYFFLKALLQLVAAKPQLRDEIRVQIVGTCEDRLTRTLASFPHKEMLRIVPRVSQREASSLICQSDLLLLTQLETYLDGKDFCVAVPGKLYSYLRSGKRILACVQEGENSEMIRAFDAGQSVHPRNVAAIAKAVEAEIEIWKSRGRIGIMAPNSLRDLARYERSNQARHLAALIYRLPSPTGFSSSTKCN